MSPQPITQNTGDRNYFMVEMEDGTRRWLGVPRDTPTNLVAARITSPDPYRRRYNRRARPAAA